MVTIPTTRGYVAIVDDEDAALARFRWQAKENPSGLVHAQRARSRAEIAAAPGPRTVYLHREILAAAEGFEVDHVNGNGLDCRRSNLRAATKRQNAQNAGRRATGRSGFKGVTFIRRTKRGREVRLSRPWLAQIMANDGYRYLGLFATAEEAARAYDAAAVAGHGAFARLNFP